MELGGKDFIDFLRPTSISGATPILANRWGTTGSGGALAFPCYFFYEVGLEKKQFRTKQKEGNRRIFDFKGTLNAVGR